MIGVAIRAEGAEWPLLLHLVTAFLLVGGVMTVAIVTVAALRAAGEREILLRAIGFRTNLLLVLPSFVALYGFGIWLADKEYGEEEPSWLEIALPLTDLAGLLGVVALTIVQWWTLRRVREGRGGGWPARIAAGLALATLVLLAVVIFLMAAKP